MCNCIKLYGLVVKLQCLLLGFGTNTFKCRTYYDA